MLKTIEKKAEVLTTLKHDNAFKFLKSDLEKV